MSKINKILCNPQFYAVVWIVGAFITWAFWIASAVKYESCVLLHCSLDVAAFLGPLIALTIWPLFWAASIIYWII